MRRTVLIALCALIVVAAAAGPAAARTPRAKMGTCVTALAQPDRYAVFVGKMKSLRRGNRMAMRFDLYSRSEALPKWTRVDAPNLGVWRRANSGVPSYTFRQRVQGLPAPARYRARIIFRWKGPKGKKSVTVKKTTPVCVQPDLRPDLRVSFDGAQAVAGHPDQADYTVVVRNAGSTAAGAAPGFPVKLVDSTGYQYVTRLVPAPLAAGGEQTLSLRGPRCATTATTVSVIVDPDGQVNESDETNDTATRMCMARRRA